MEAGAEGAQGESPASGGEGECPGVPSGLQLLDSLEPSSGLIILGPWKNDADAAGLRHVQAGRALALLADADVGHQVKPEPMGLIRPYTQQYCQVWSLGSMHVADRLEEVARYRDMQCHVEGGCKHFGAVAVRSWSRPLVPWAEQGSGPSDLGKAVRLNMLHRGEPAPGRLSKESIRHFPGEQLARIEGLHVTGSLVLTYG